MTKEGNKMRWDMESIFPGGSASAEFERFRKAITDDLEKAKKTLAGLPRKIDDESTQAWVDLMLSLQEIKQRRDHAESFAYCLSAQDVNDEGAMGILEQMMSMYAASEAIKSGVEELAITADDPSWARLVSHPKLTGATFYWNELRRNAKHKMDPRLEKLATDLSVNGYHGWNLLYIKLAGDLRNEFVEDGKTEMLSMGQLANKMSSPDRELRKQAFGSLTSAWKSVEPLAAIELNALAGFRLSLYKARQWESPLFEPFLLARVKRETIDAMWAAIVRGRDRIADYIRAKKKMLGIDNFRWYDQLAPVGEIAKSYSYDEATDFVVKHLSSFSPEMGEFARAAIDKRWIEAEDRSGKMAGGFCTGFPIIKQSRVFMTFSGNYSEMMTLAHELGHAYHSWVLRERDYFARRYPMTLAETASTFSEMLVTDAALASAGDPNDRLSLVDKKLQEHLAMFCDIHCRFLFETRFYEERKKGTVSRERLGELMVEAQKAAYGDILADDGYHPLFWAAKMHFSETGVPFYNFPYTFGHLFAGGIYDRAKKEGAAFEPKYRALLADTGSMTCEQLAEKHLGHDLTGQKFWNDAVDRALEDVDLFIRLAGRS